MLIPFELMKNLIIDDQDENTRFKVRIKTCTRNEMKRLIELDDSYIDVYDYHIITNYEELKKAYEQ